MFYDILKIEMNYLWSNSVALVLLATVDVIDPQSQIQILSSKSIESYEFLKKILISKKKSLLFLNVMVINNNVNVYLYSINLIFFLLDFVTFEKKAKLRVTLYTVQKKDDST